MGRVRSLSQESFGRFFIFTTIILLCCFPLLYILMEYIYSKDLDEVLQYRTEEFLKNTLPELTIEDLPQWNKFNEDMAILPFDNKYQLNKIGQEEFFNKTEGHPVFYRRLYTAINLGDSTFVLTVRVPMVEEHDLRTMLVAQYGIIFIILLINLSIANIYISKRLWKPFYKTLEVIEQFRLESGKKPQFEKTDIKEFKRLNEQLSKLITENLSIYSQQKEFVENASHELQTPLAVFQSQLDTLLQQPNLTEKEMDILQSLYSTSSRMSRLNKNLLLLARIDNEQFEKRDSVDLVKVLYKQLNPLRELAESNGIKVSATINSTLRIKANEILLESLISNLITNAIRHNTGENGVIHISLDKNELSISNTGKKDSLVADRIFKRFSRISEEKKGNGLGLSIVKQICKFHNWEIEYQYKDEKHTFSVKFNQ